MEVQLFARRVFFFFYFAEELKGKLKYVNKLSFIFNTSL